MDNGQIGQYNANSYYNMPDVGNYRQQEGVTVKAAADTFVLQKNTGEPVSVADAGIGADKTLKNFIMDALKAAGLPQNDRMMQLVKSLLGRQQPVDRNTLIMYNRLLGQNPGVSPETLISMQKNGFSISKESIVQFENYQNDEGRIFRNIDDAADDIGRLVKQLFNGNDGKAVDLLNGLAKFVNDMTTATGGKNVEIPAGSATVTSDVAMNQQLSHSAFMQTAATEGMAGQPLQVADGVMMQNMDILEKDFMEALLEEVGEHLTAEIKEKIQDGNLFEKLSAIFDNLPQEKLSELAHRIDTKEFEGVAKEVLKEALFLEPENVSDKEQLTKYYKKLDESVKEVLNVTKELGDTVNNSALAKTFNNISDNVAFMNQVNEYMPYIQMPLKLLKEEAHGEFYVMKRRRQGAQQGDTLTAFLRLNMEHLGELDIMVKLKGMALDVDIKAEKSEIVDFIDGSLNMLGERLREKGYIPAMRASEKEKEFDFEKDFLEAESNEGTIGRYSFDMKI